MPVITATFDPAVDVSPADAERFNARVAGLCLDQLSAAPDKVQILMVRAIAPVHGASIYIGVQYRHQDFRSPGVMDGFMQALDHLCMELFGKTPRIRCFPSRNDQLFARN